MFQHWCMIDLIVKDAIAIERKTPIVCSLEVLHQLSNGGSVPFLSSLDDKRVSQPCCVDVESKYGSVLEVACRSFAFILRVFF